MSSEYRSVSVSIYSFKKRCHGLSKTQRIFYARLDEFWKKEQKLSYLETTKKRANVDWQQVEPDHLYNWISMGLQWVSSDFIDLGSKDAKSSKGTSPQTIFKLFGGGVKSNRDSWVFNFDRKTLEKNIKSTIGVFNSQMHSWSER